jgi:DNA-binding NarL/FixJ family response regulator
MRLVVADDFPEIIDAVERCLAPEYEIVGRVSDGVALVEAVCQLKPDLLVSDVSMPKMTGIEAVRRLRNLGCQTPAIILTIHDDEELVKEALASDAKGFVLKSRLGRDLPLAVREVLAGRTFIGRTGNKGLPDELPEANPEPIHVVTNPAES